MATAIRRRPAPQGRPTTSSRRATARRRAARRRRVLLAALLAALVGLGVVLLTPVAQRVESEFGLPLSYPGVIRRQAAIEHLDPALVAAVIDTETKFDPRQSSAGADGLMQVMPSTALFLARRSGATSFRVSDLNNPRVNIAYGAYYLRYLLDEYHGSTVLALAAYNGGETNVDRWLARARAHGHGLTIDEIPFPETRAYVQQVLEARQDYRQTYARQLGLS